MFKELCLTVYYFFEAIAFLFVPNYFRRKDVSNDIVLITGGGLGLGRLLAIRFAKLGSTVVIWGRTEQHLRNTAEQITRDGGRCHYYCCDISDHAAVYSTADSVRRDVGNVTILINNAGIVNGKLFLDLTEDEIEMTFKVNTLGRYWVTKAFLPQMMSNNKGHLVSVDSVASFFGESHQTDYGPSKAASYLMLEAVRNELLGSGYTGINTTSICPYFFNTGMFEGIKTKVFNILDQEDVANNAMEAILTDKKLDISWFFAFARISQTIFPNKSFHEANGLIYDPKTMVGLKGRSASIDGSRMSVMSAPSDKATNGSAKTSPGKDYV